MMIKKIILENFMAHAHTEVELGPGLTALTGPNNTGKSAIVEALRCVATNPTPRHYIRHGAKETRVTVELEDGIRIVWIRKKASAGYEIHLPNQEEPQSFWKLGRGNVPEEVRDILRLDPVLLEQGESVDVHIGNQREPVFLLNMPDRAVADFLASSTEGAHLLSMQGVLKRRSMEAKKEIAGRSAVLNHIETELDTLRPLPRLHLLAESCREQEECIAANQGVIPALERTLAERTNMERKKQKLKENLGILQGLHPLPDLEPVAPLANALEQQSTVQTRLASCSAYSSSLAELAPPPALLETASLRDAARRLQSLEDSLACAVKRSTSLESLLPVPQVAPLASLQGLLGDMHMVLNQHRQACKELDKVTLELEQFHKQLEERLALVGTCPSCGQPMNAQHFIQEGPNHEL